MKKKIIATVLAGALFMSNTVFAAPLKNVMYGGLEVCEVITINDTKMIPIRGLAEVLGYTVEWDAETKGISLSKMPQYFTMQIGVDGYTTARTAPQPLGAAPIIANGSTYVPVDFLTELMPEKAIVNEGSIVIYGSGEITDVTEETITINEDFQGEIVLNLSDELKITSEADNAVLDTTALEVGKRVYVDFGTAMTMSLPPINTPTEIIIAE